MRRRIDFRFDVWAAMNMAASRESTMQMAEVAYEDDPEQLGKIWNFLSTLKQE